MSSAKRNSGSSDGANDSGFEVLAAADKIQHFILDGIEQQPVDGEVAALDIFLSALAEAYLVGMAAVAVADVTAEGGDLNRVVRVVSERNQHNSELRAHGVGFGKDPHDFVGRGVGGNVVIGGFDTEQQIAHAAADQVSLVARVHATCE